MGRSNRSDQSADGVLEGGEEAVGRAEVEAAGDSVGPVDGLIVDGLLLAAALKLPFLPAGVGDPTHPLHQALLYACEQLRKAPLHSVAIHSALVGQHLPLAASAAHLLGLRRCVRVEGSNGPDSEAGEVLFGESPHFLERKAKLVKEEEVEYRADFGSCGLDCRSGVAEGGGRQGQSPGLVQDVEAEDLHSQPHSHQHARLLQRNLPSATELLRKVQPRYFGRGEVVGGGEGAVGGGEHQKLEEVAGDGGGSQSFSHVVQHLQDFLLLVDDPLLDLLQNQEVAPQLLFQQRLVVPPHQPLDTRKQRLAAPLRPPFAPQQTLLHSFTHSRQKNDSPHSHPQLTTHACSPLCEERERLSVFEGLREALVEFEFLVEAEFEGEIGGGEGGEGVEGVVLAEVVLGTGGSDVVLLLKGLLDASALQVAVVAPVELPKHLFHSITS